MKIVYPVLRARRIELGHAGSDAGLVVRADHDKARQILINLLANAVKFTEPGGRIELSATARDDGMVVLGVSDTGSGIPPSQLERIFLPFVQLEGLEGRPQQGTGLGLAISRDLARGMGGDLTVESTLGEGSTFTLVLPQGMGA